MILHLKKVFLARNNTFWQIEGAEVKHDNSFLNFQPENSQMMYFQCKIWSSFYLHEALYELKFTSWKTKLLPNIFYVITIIFSVSFINLFFQKKIPISCVYYLLSQRFFYLMTVKLRKVRNNLLKEMNPKWDCIISKNTCFQQIFMGAEKESKEILRL